MNTSNPKFWAAIGAVVGFVLAAGGSVNTPIDALLGALIQSGIWFGVSTLIINRKNKNKDSNNG
jgi:threonine/homoserine/homoserine lactone efflux protein